MNITQRMYFGQFPLDKDRDRRIVFYGRVSTQHEAQVDALGNQMQWYDDQLRYHPNWQVVDRYIDEGITGTSAKKRPAFMKMLSDAKCGKFDLIFLDPPYDTGLLDKALANVVQFDILAEGGIIVCESRREKELPQLPQPYYLLTERSYGKIKLTLYGKGTHA
jgi:16S rRNA G966 N2-methylase RsmD